MWGMITLSVFFYGLAGLCKGVMDTLQFHFSSSIFMDKNQMYWNPSKSWINDMRIAKYKDGDPSKGPRFPGSTTIFAWLTDGWHLFQTFNLACYRASIVFLGSAFFQLSETGWKNALAWFAIWVALIFVHSAGFHLTYSIILKRKKDEAE